MSDSFKRVCFDDDAYKIHITQGKPEADALAVKMHYDPDTVIEYFKEGRGVINIEGKGYAFQEGDVVLITPAELHTSHINDDSPLYRVSIHLSRKLLEPFRCDADAFFEFFEKKKKGQGNVIGAETVKEHGIDRIIDDLEKYAALPEPQYRVLTRCKAIELLHAVSNAAHMNALDVAQPYVESDLINRILQYINNHYTENITLSSVSDHLHHSKYYICIQFKKYVGITITEYINIRRIRLVNDLIRSGYSVHEACYAAGFHNYSNFYRVYLKHMGITPQQFKSNQKDER